MSARQLKLITTALAVSLPITLVAVAGKGARPAQAQPAGNVLAQLYPVWTTARAKCHGMKKKMRCTVDGSVTVYNDGDAASAATKLDLWVSKDDVLDPKTDVKFGSLDVQALPAGQKQKLDFHLSTPKGTKVVKRILIAVVDPGNVVAESDEEDNQDTLGPLQ